MSEADVVAWLNSYDRIFDVLQRDVVANAEACGVAGLAAERRVSEHVMNTALGHVVSTAGVLLSTCDRAIGLPPIPDEETQLLFEVALGNWLKFATRLRAAALGRDMPDILRALEEQKAGADDFLRMAAALRRAAGAPPDPNNPMQ